MASFEINCDLGEGMANDAALMPWLDACSVACGGHAGDDGTMHEVLRLARQHGVKAGAHPSFPDREGFGRRRMELDATALAASIDQQIRSLLAICEEEQVRLDHIKLHGALYHLAASDPSTAQVVVEVAGQFPGVCLFAPWQSALDRLASAKSIPVKWEGFADRRYTQEATLVPRSHTQAVITDPQMAVDQVRQVASTSSVTSLTGQTIPLKAHTFCVHGDNPRALDIAKRLKQLRHE